MATNGSALQLSSHDEEKAVQLVGRCPIIPVRPSPPEQIKLSIFDLQLLYCHYIQRGLIYSLMPKHDFGSAVELLKKSLSEVLVFFYPLAGRLTTLADGVIYVDCNDAGIEFIEASADGLSVAELITTDVPPVVKQLFALNGALNLEGHSLPFLAVQVTKLRDGLSVGCTLNHAIADGASFWHFFNSWSQLCKLGIPIVSPLPLHDRSNISPDDSTIRLNLDPAGAIPRVCPPLLRVKIFHFKRETIEALKDRANRQASKDGGVVRVPVSSFQALCGHVWQAVTRARHLAPHEHTTFRVAVNCRSRLVPPLAPFYFGNAAQSIYSTATAGEILSGDVSFPAGLLHDIIDGHRDGAIRGSLRRWEEEPIVYRMDKFEKSCVVMGSSPRFGMYNNDFGWGEPVAVRSGGSFNFDGKVWAHPGKEGGGSVDLEICLYPDFMHALEEDTFFISPLYASNP